MAPSTASSMMKAAELHITIRAISQAGKPPPWIPACADVQCKLVHRRCSQECLSFADVRYRLFDCKTDARVIVSPKHMWFKLILSSKWDCRPSFAQLQHPWRRILCLWRLHLKPSNT